MLSGMSDEGFMFLHDRVEVRIHGYIEKGKNEGRYYI